MRMRPGGIFLAASLVVVLGWPAAATVLAAWRDGGGAAGSGLIGWSPSDLLAGRVARPVDLARTTVALVALTELIALPIGLPLAFLLFRTDVLGRRPILLLLALAAFVPMPLHATAWIGGFGNLGRMQAFGSVPILTGIPGAAFVHAMAALPWIVLLAGVGLRAVEPELEEAALLDRPAWRVVAGVTARRAAGAIAGAALAVAVLTAGDMTVTDLLQVRSYAEEAYVQFQIGQGPAAAAAVALPPLAVLGALVVFGTRSLLRADPARLASITDRGKVWRLGRWRIPLGLALAGTTATVVGLPVFSLVWRAGRVGGAAALGRPPHWSISGLGGTMRGAVLDVAGSLVIGPLREALATGSWSALGRRGRWFGSPLASPLIESLVWGSLGATAAVLLAWSLAWFSRGPGPWRWVCALSVALALATPGPVAGMALKAAYLEFPPIYDTPFSIVLAYVLRTFPYALLILWPAVRAIPPESLEAAELDGLGPWWRIWRVERPYMRGALTAAWGVAFVLALGELPTSNLVVPPGTSLIAIEIWSLLHTGVESHLAGVALLMLATVLAAGLLAAWALARFSRAASSGA